MSDDPLTRRGVHISDVDNQVVGTADALLIRLIAPNAVAQDVYLELRAAEKLMALLQEALTQTYAQLAADGRAGTPPTTHPRQETVRTFRVGHTRSAEAAVLQFVTNEDRPLDLTIPRQAATELSRQLASTVSRLRAARPSASPPKPRRPH